MEHQQPGLSEKKNRAGPRGFEKKKERRWKKRRTLPAFLEKDGPFLWGGVLTWRSEVNFEKIGEKFFIILPGGPPPLSGMVQKKISLRESGGKKASFHPPSNADPFPGKGTGAKY